MPASCLSDWREAGAPAAPSRKAAIGDRSSTQGSPPPAPRAPARMPASCISDSAASGGRQARPPARLRRRVRQRSAIAQAREARPRSGCRLHASATGGRQARRRVRKRSAITRGSPRPGCRLHASATVSDSAATGGRQARPPRHRVRQRLAIAQAPCEAREARPGPDAGFMHQRPEGGRRARRAIA